MAFPDGLVLRRIQVGAAVSQTGKPMRVQVKLIPSMRLVHAASGTVLSEVVEEFTVQPGEAFVFEVPAVDQDGVLGPDGLPVTFWSYRTEQREEIYTQNPYATTVFSWDSQPVVRRTIQPGTSDDVFDLDTAPVEGVTIPPLTGAWMGPLAERPDWAQIVYDTTDPDADEIPVYFIEEATA